jgi:group I intron endonuclease
MISNIHNSLKNKGGIYKISNTIDERIYIGSTNNFQKRYNDHKKKLSIQTHANKYLQAFCNKYGSDALLFEILTICKNGCLLYSEQYFIKLLIPEFNIKRIIERKVFSDELEYDYNKSHKIAMEILNTIIDDYTHN